MVEHSQVASDFVARTQTSILGLGIRDICTYALPYNATKLSYRSPDSKNEYAELRVK